MLWTFDVPMLAAKLYNEEEDLWDNYTVVIRPIDSDIYKIKHLDQSVDIGSGPIMGSALFSSGRALDPSTLPKRMTVTSTVGPVPKGKMQLPDIMQPIASNIVHVRVKDIIEGLEPDTHQFVPVTLEWKGGEPVAESYFFFAPCIRLFALDHARSKPDVRLYPDKPGFINPRDDVPLAYLKGGPRGAGFAPVFHRSRVGGAQIFGAGDIGSSMLMITDAVKQAFDAAGVTGPVYFGPYALSD